MSNQRYINNNKYPVVMMDSTGRKEVAPGEVVIGVEYSKMIDPRKGLTVYHGERPIGKMARINNINPNNQVQVNKVTTTQNIFSEKDMPAGVKMEQEQEIKVVDASASTGRYLDKNLEEWKKESQLNGLSGLTRGQLIGLGSFIGIDITSVQDKNVIAKEILTRLNPKEEKKQEEKSKK